MRRMIDIAWFAGIIEGEGTFKYLRFCPGITISMTDKDTIERCAKIIRYKKLKIHTYLRKDGNSNMHTIALWGNRAIQWMMTIYPLMSARRKAKIRSILEQWKVYVKGTPAERHWKVPYTGPTATKNQALRLMAREILTRNQEIEVNS